MDCREGISQVDDPREGASCPVLGTAQRFSVEKDRLVSFTKVTLYTTTSPAPALIHHETHFRSFLPSHGPNQHPAQPVLLWRSQYKRRRRRLFARMLRARDALFQYSIYEHQYSTRTMTSSCPSAHLSALFRPSPRSMTPSAALHTSAYAGRARTNAPRQAGRAHYPTV